MKPLRIKQPDVFRLFFHVTNTEALDRLYDALDSWNNLHNSGEWYNLTENNEGVRFDVNLTAEQCDHLEGFLNERLAV